MTDDDGHAWLDEHQRRADQLIYFFYASGGTKRGRDRCPDKMAQDFNLARHHHHSARRSCSRNGRLHRLRRR